jgi:hypothetical protein
MSPMSRTHEYLKNSFYFNADIAYVYKIRVPV